MTFIFRLTNNVSRVELTVVADKLDRPFAERVVESTLRQASYPEGDPQYEPVLRALVESWIVAGCRFERWAKANPEKEANLSRQAHKWTLRFETGTKGKPAPILSSYPWVPGRLEEIDTAEHTGYDAFVTFLVCAAPRFDIGKCACCERFFWNRWGHLNKRFCSRKCAQLKTASAGQARQLRAERREKNRRILRSIRKFIESKPGATDWRRWVATDAGVTLNYVTHTLNRGERGEPDSLKLTVRQRASLEESLFGHRLD